MWEKHLWQGIYPAPSKALQKDRQTRNSPAGGCSLKAWRRTNFSALPFMVFLVVMALGAVGIDLTAKASDTGVAAEDTALDYRLAPGDRLTVVVFDQPQLSGDLIIDVSRRDPVAAGRGRAPQRADTRRSPTTYPTAIYWQCAGPAERIREYRPISAYIRHWLC